MRDFQEVGDCTNTVLLVSARTVPDGANDGEDVWRVQCDDAKDSLYLLVQTGPNWLSGVRFIEESQGHTGRNPGR